jgi:hypothetical protein
MVLVLCTNPRDVLPEAAVVCIDTHVMLSHAFYAAAAGVCLPLVLCFQRLAPKYAHNLACICTRG